MILYGILEVDIAIICACAPALHAFFRTYFGQPQDKGRPHFSIKRRIQRHHRCQTDYDLEETTLQAGFDEVDRSYSEEPAKPKFAAQK